MGVPSAGEQGEMVLPVPRRLAREHPLFGTAGNGWDAW